MINLQGEVFLFVDGKQPAIWRNRIYDSVLTAIMEKASFDTDYPDSLIPAKIAINVFGGENFSYQLTETIDGREWGIDDDGDGFIRFVANGFYPAVSTNHKVLISDVYLMSESVALAHASSQSVGAIDPNPDIYYQQHVQIVYKITVSGANSGWLSKLLKIMLGYEFMTSGNWKADNSQFIQLNEAFLLKDDDLLSLSPISLARSTNTSADIASESDIVFQSVSLSSGMPNKIKVFSRDPQGGVELAKQFDVSIANNVFNQGDSVVAPFSLYVF